MSKKDVRTYSELSKAIAEQRAKLIEDKFENGEIKRHCSTCECEQVLKLIGDKPKCMVCEKEFDFDFKTI